MTPALVVMGVMMAVLGHLVHLLKKVVELRASGEQIGLIGFVRSRPYRTALGVAGSAAAMGYLFDSGNVTAMAAFGFGYMADSGLAIAGSRYGVCRLGVRGAAERRPAQERGRYRARGDAKAPRRYV